MAPVGSAAPANNREGTHSLDGTQFAWASLILCVAAFVQGLTGFGFGMIAMAFLPLVLPFSEATLLVAVLGLALNVVTFLQHRHEYQWRQGWLLIVGAAVGCPLGTYLLTTLDERLMIRLLGALIVIFSLRELFFTRNLERGLPEWSGLPLGALAGLFGSAFNIGGPPAIVYVYSQSWSHAARLAVLQVMFLEIGILRLGLTAAVGSLNRDALTSAAWLFLPLILAVLAGHWVLSRITPGRLQRPVWLFLLAMGLKYVISPDSPLPKEQRAAQAEVSSPSEETSDDSSSSKMADTERRSSSTSSGSR